MILGPFELPRKLIRRDRFVLVISLILSISNERALGVTRRITLSVPLGIAFEQNSVRTALSRYIPKSDTDLEDSPAG